MSRIVVNCQGVRFASTLGVAHAVLRLCTALADQHELIFVLNDVATATGPAGETIEAIATQVLDVAQAGALGEELRATAVELLPHHFQRPEFCDRSVMMCHDLHVFDIPWKYGDRATILQNSFRRNLVAASAVITHFPRTYYAIERTSGIVIRNLFLTESPLLLDGVLEPADPTPAPDREDAFQLLYPPSCNCTRITKDSYAELRSFDGEEVWSRSRALDQILSPASQAGSSPWSTNRESAIRSTFWDASRMTC